MANLSEEEALALVAVRGHCDDVGQWKRIPRHEGAWEIQSGILDEFGSRCNQFIRLDYVESSATSLQFQFTLFLNTKFELQRIYQLDIRRGEQSSKNKHQISHEHLGAARYFGPASWQTWDFDRVLAHFCHKANIYFSPVLKCPTTGIREINHARKHR